MKVLFAVSNDKMSEAIVKQYEKQYKEIIIYKNVYYFNAILKELQRDKNYDRVVISEDLEQYVNNDYEQMDNFIFGRLDSISDEASNSKGEDIPIILICEERRTKGEEILIKLFGIGIYNAIIGSDRSINEACRLINRPRSKKEAKIYYKIDSDNVSYEKNDENDVSELEIQNILAHYKKIGNDEQRILESFDSIASQYNDIQLKIICKFLPLNVRAVLEEKSRKYAEIFSFGNGVADNIRRDSREQKEFKLSKKSGGNIQQGTSEIMLGNSENNFREPVVIPSAMSSNKKIVIQSNPVAGIEMPNDENKEDFIETNIENDTNDISNEFVEVETRNISETIEQPVKRGRGRPKKILTEEEKEKENLPKRKRGRPRKVVQEEIIDNDEPIVEENILPGFQNEIESIDTADKINSSNVQEDIEENENVLPGFEDEEIESTYSKEDNILPGFENDDDEMLSSFQPKTSDEKQDTYNQFRNNTSYMSYQGAERINTKQYEELDINRLITPGQKIVSFVGTSKNGTSFLVNNVAEILSMNNINTAILDLTQNRNAYYIYTKNEENLRIKANECFKNLKNGETSGIEVHKNLIVYTSAFDIEEIEEVEPIVEKLLKKHTIILLDCDFDTPDRYFKYSQEIYLVQSMDILTIQPLTLFLRKLYDKGSFDENKVRVILNKYVRTKELNEDILVGGISIYNDASMTVRKELFNRKEVKRITIPFEVETYLRYLDGLVICDVSLKGYSKKLLQSLKQLATLVYSNSKNYNTGKYVPPSAKNSTFSPSMNSTLEQMSKRY